MRIRTQQKTINLDQSWWINRIFSLRLVVSIVSVFFANLNATKIWNSMLYFKSLWWMIWFRSYITFFFFFVILYEFPITIGLFFSLNTSHRPWIICHVVFFLWVCVPPLYCYRSSKIFAAKVLCNKSKQTVEFLVLNSPRHGFLRILIILRMSTNIKHWAIHFAVVKDVEI